MHVPMRKAVLRELAVPEVPLAAQPADPAIVSEDVGVSHLAGEISGCGVADVALSDPVVDAVLRGNRPVKKVARLGEQTGVATKKLSKRMPVWAMRSIAGVRISALP